MNWITRLANRLFFDHWRAIDADSFASSPPAEAPARLESTAASAGKGKSKGKGKGKSKTRPGPVEAAPATPRGIDWRTLVVMATVAVSLTLQEYFGERALFRELFPPNHAWFGGEHWELWQFAWWSGWRFFGYVVIPSIVILLMPGERWRDYFVSPRGFFKHLWIYVVLFLTIFPAILLASGTRSFQQTYPFYKLANQSTFDLWTWELLYALQFVSLEFFFRGFILHGLRRRFGASAIFVMIVPYCMIHYGKPFPETMGAIGAGIILGTLAMRTKSIWGGVLIHVGVAVSMDLLALRHCPPAGGLPCASR